jgi:hypothetical protein
MTTFQKDEVCKLSIWLAANAVQEMTRQILKRCHWY